MLKFWFCNVKNGYNSVSKYIKGVSLLVNYISITNNTIFVYDVNQIFKTSNIGLKKRLFLGVLLRGVL